MSQLGRVWFIMLKDLKIFSRDRLALFFFVVFPFLFVVVFNFVLSDVGSEDDRLVLHVANCGAAREASLTGLPAAVRTLKAVRASWDRGREDLPGVDVRAGKAELDLARFSLLTLTSP